MDFAVLADHWVKLRESEKGDKYLDLARELKKLWDIKLTVIPVVIGTLGTVTKGLVQGLKDLKISGRVEPIQTTALLRLAGILRLEETCSHSNSSEKTSANADAKNSKMNKMIIIIMVIIITRYIKCFQTFFICELLLIVHI